MTGGSPGREELRARLAALSPAQRAALAERVARPRSGRPLRFGLFYFADSADGSVDGGTGGGERYRFLLDTATLADSLGFTAVWTPERHFHSFGGLYPNPSVLSAALAVATERVQIRAGSVVLPLHHPVRVCEDWAIVDNLSGGRVGISFATGWHGTDFVFAPQHYAQRRTLTWDTIPVVQRLWRGEPQSFPGPDGQPVTPTLFPRPVQPELPVWVTASGNRDTFAQAAVLGANVLTALIGQSPDELAAHIAHYRATRAEHGHDPDAGTVTVMLHAYLTEDAATARERARAPLREYLRGYLAQQRDMITPAAGGATDTAAGGATDTAASGATDTAASGATDTAASGATDTAASGATDTAGVEAQLDFAYERYATQTALIGSPASVRPLLDRLADAGADEIACLVDFGIPREDVISGIRLLATVKDEYQPRATTPPASLNGTGTGTGTSAALGVDQERMYRLERAHPAGPANYVTTGLRITGPLDPDVLDAALRIVGGRHEALRTTFDEPGGVAAQRISPRFDTAVERFDLTDLPPEQRRRAARELRTEFARRPFHLDRPLLRLALIRLDEREHQLAVVKHHMITDWVSFTVFLRELFTCYGALLQGRTPELPAPRPYREFAERERARLRDGRMAEQLGYWDAQLDGAPEPVTFPLAVERPAKQTFEGRREWMRFSEQTTARLGALSRAQRVTPFMTAFTVLNTCLMRTCGVSDLVLGSPTANRDWAPEELLGLLLRPMVLRTRLRPEQTFLSALADTRRTVSGALANAEVPYQALVDRIRPERDLDWLPLFKLRYLFLRWDEPVTLAGLSLSPLDTDPKTSLYDGTISLWDSTHGAFGRIEYNSDLFARDTIVDTVETFASMLDVAVRDPEMRIGELAEHAPSPARRFHVDEDELEDHLARQGGPR